MLQRMALNDDVDGKHIADLGCGCGVLTVASVIMDCGFCTGFDIDENALQICKQNIEERDIDNTDLLQSDVTKIVPGDEYWQDKFDTVVMNPPFGTKQNEGIDMHFLKVALTMARTSVYSLHKASTIEHIENFCKRLKVKLSVEDRFDYELKNSYKFHKSKSVHIDVILIKCTFLKDKEDFVKLLLKENSTFS